MKFSKIFPVIGLVVVALLTRFLPHPPNFTAVNAAALFSAYVIGNQRISLLVLYAAMLVSDCVIGFHSQMVFVYASLGLSAQLSNSRFPLYFSIPASSLLFFGVVNFGVWLSDGIYPLSAEGLGLCYTAALPFLGNQLIGDLFFSGLLFGGYSLYEKTAFAGKHELA